MKKYKLFVLTIAISLLLAIAVFLGYEQLNGTNKLPVCAVAVSDGLREIITPWSNENGEYYLFIPGYAELSQVSILKETSADLFLDGIPLIDGMSAEVLRWDYPYELTYTLHGTEKHVKLTLMRSDGVSTIYIDTVSGSMEYIHDKKGNKESASMRIYDSIGNLCNEVDIDAINGRGNSTWQGYDKEPYSLHFASEIDLLGMGAAKEWILLANAADRSNIRNKLVYDFASDFGLAYSPDSEWVDLYLNGEYAGLYLLCERNEVHENRVDISLDDGYLISMELESRLEDRKVVYVRTEADQTLRIHYPLVVNDVTLASLRNSWQAVENAIMSADGIDKSTGKSWLELIDLESWAKKYLIEEVFGNIDGGYISQYFYMDSSGKAFAGPVWDYDYAIGNDELWQLQNADIQLVNKLNVNKGICRPWFYSLCQKEEFLAHVLSVFESEFVPLMETVLSDRIGEYTALISKAVAVDAVRWSADRDWVESVIDVVDYMNDRLRFFETLWFEDTEFYTVCLYSRDNENNSYRMIASGETVLDLPILKDTASERFLGWYYADTDEAFDPDAPIDADTDLYAKWEKVPTSKIKNVIKIMPIGAIAILFVCLLAVDVKRNFRNGRI